ncbi:MAG: hypothetical protein JKY31_09815 [Rhodobacteraceae bacterium]|nr:hypothetical protein [Paracoccaceae bacterium]
MTYELKIGSSKPLNFKDAKSLLVWCEDELNAWEWVVTSNIRGLRGFLNPVRKLANELRNVIEPISSQQVNSLIANSIRNVQNSISGNQYIYSKSPLGKFVIQEHEVDVQLALDILYIKMLDDRREFQIQKNYLVAANALFNFERGISKRGVSSSVKSIEILRADLESLIKSEEVESENRIEKLDELVISREIDADEWKNALVEIKERDAKRGENLKLQLSNIYNKSVQDVRQIIEQISDDTTREIDAFKKAMKEEIALKEPIDYWDKKATNHTWATVILAVLFVAYSATALLYLKSFILSFDDGVQGFLASWQDTGIGAVASFAGLIGIGMVIARVLYRLFASQLHLWNDARERVTMIQTYLALAAEGHAKEEFLGALIQRLFSPTSDGIVKSDLGAVGPLDGFATLLSK